MLFALSFAGYQYKREKHYKQETLKHSLQTYAYEINLLWGDDGATTDSLLRKYTEEKGIGNLSIRILQADSLLYQNKTADTSQSACTEEVTLGSRRIIVSAPREAQQSEADYAPTFYLLVITALFGWVLYHNTERVGRHVKYLRRFARKAERGEAIDEERNLRLPNDELGDISQNIVALYWKLRHSEEDKQRIKRQLTQNVAHELKTPAASIHGFLETIIQNPDMPEEKKQHFLQRCLAQSERMRKLLFDMEVLTKLDDMDAERTQKMERQPLDVVPIVHAVLADTMLQLQQKDILATVDLPSQIIVDGDATLVYGIFRNLIDNCIAYATGATIVDISCRNQSAAYQFIVSDNGVGIPEEHLPHLFERFYRIDKGRSRAVGGTGLGLSIVKNSVALHGGTCSARNNPNGGLRIEFTMAKSTHS